MSTSTERKTSRPAIVAETYFPDKGQACLRALETTQTAEEVWQLVCQLGADVGLPFIDFISASDWRDWKRALFVRTSYDASWLEKANTSPELYHGSYFRIHGEHRLTPICMGLEFIDDHPDLPEYRRDILKQAAARGMRAGISIPLRQHTPRATAMVSFIGDHDREALLDILSREYGTLAMCAWAAHHRYLLHFSEEYFDRNGITIKQRELLEMIGSGLLDKQIAEQLGVTVSAVRQRQNALMQKTNTSKRTELAALAMSLGLLPDPHNPPEDDVTDGSEVHPRIDGQTS
ncbi:helix-turn-helix transcriptional regulator [Sagittula sp. SSi028]|uniref:helix-turn-helix transcriptional regulator n=1 Tax=Sagittula sp. SSi028 TaxID=3400636 RepID=UPI003AF4D508